MNKIYKNNHLLEVNCGFHFDLNDSRWDSTYFGQFYDKIKGFGFNEKIERKGIQVTIKEDKEVTKSRIASQEIEDQVIFKNANSGLAIILAKDKISFHSLGRYIDWDDFSKNFVKPMFEIYLNLGLGSGNAKCNVVYLNRFVIDKSSKISEHLNFINEINNLEDVYEVDSNFQRVFRKNDLTLLLRGNYIIDKNNLSNKIINLECGSIIDDTKINIENLINIIDKVHSPIRELFENSITEQLKNTL
jgi:uncharacterized protein (TIGR04255 family)